MKSYSAASFAGLLLIIFLILALTVSVYSTDLKGKKPCCKQNRKLAEVPPPSSHEEKKPCCNGRPMNARTPTDDVQNGEQDKESSGQSAKSCCGVFTAWNVCIGVAVLVLIVVVIAFAKYAFAIQH